jgi:DNA-binding NarL/FixJ family response regulator
MKKETIRLLHIDDHKLFVQGVFSLLEEVSHIQWLGSASNIQEGMVMLNDLKPDLVLLDYFLPDGNGIEATNKIHSALPKVPILILTMENNPTLLEKCKKAGVMAFLPKTIDKNQLTNAIEAAASGKTTFPVLERIPSLKDYKSKNIFSLSKREKEIAFLVAKGYTSRQISEKLFLSLLTVNTHRRNLLQKLGLNNTAQLSSMINNFNIED